MLVLLLLLLVLLLLVLLRLVLPTFDHSKYALLLVNLATTPPYQGDRAQDGQAHGRHARPRQHSIAKRQGHDLHPHTEGGRRAQGAHK